MSVENNISSQKMQINTMSKMQSSENKSVLVVDLTKQQIVNSSNKILQKPIITKGLQTTIATTNKDNLQELDNDESRKKRCADRYDSSESSDSGVATLSCTDSSTTSSDTSDPGSPYSLTCDDNNTSNVNHNNNKMPPHQKTISKIKTIAATATPAASTPITSAAMVTPKTNTIHQKQQNQPHQWPWNNRPLPQKISKPTKSTAITAPIAATDLACLQLLQQQQQQINANNNKLKRSTDVLQTNLNGIKRVRTTPATDAWLNPPAEKKDVNKLTKPQLIMDDEANPQKITGYFKSQIKTNATLKKELSNLVAKTTVGKKVTPQQQLHAMNSSENYYNLLTQQTKDGVPSKSMDILKNELDIRTLTAAITPMVKKTERKTAKITPTVRKAPASNAGLPPSVSITQLPKKQPVAIAPRMPELKPTSQAKKFGTEMVNLQKLALEQAKHCQPKVLLTAIRIPSQQQQQLLQNGQKVQPLNGMQHKHTPPPGLTLTTSTNSNSMTNSSAPPLFQIPVLPNLVQIPNLVTAANAAKNAATNLMVNNGLTSNAAKWNNQLFMHGAAFMKLQQFGQNGTMDATQGLQNYVAKQVPFTTSTTNTMESQLNQSYQLKTQNGYPISTTPPPLAPTQQHQHHHHHQMTPQVFMTSSGLLLNTSVPTLLTQTQLTSLHAMHQQQMHHQQTANLPALHPIQPQHSHHQQSVSNTSTTSTVLPSINTILHNNHHHQQHQQQMNSFYQNNLYQQQAQMMSQPLMTTSVTSKFTTQQQQQYTTTANFVPISSAHLFITSSAAPTLTVSAGATTTVTTNNQFTPSLQPPPLLATCIQQQQQQKVVYQQQQQQQFQLQIPQQKPQPQQQSQQQPKPKPSIPSTTISQPIIPTSSPQLYTTKEPPKLVSVQSVDTTTTLLTVLPSNQPPKQQLMVQQPPSPVEATPAPSIIPVLATNALTIATKPVKSLTSAVTTSTDLCSPTLPLLSPKARIQPCLASPKSLVLERIKSKKPPEIYVDEFDEITIVTIHPPTIDTEFQTASLPESAKSPILSQPKTIRFPRMNGNAMRMGSKGSRRSDYNSNNGVCGWDGCGEKFELNSLLMDHLQTQHINSQTGPYVCLWAHCKVHSKESVSRSWLERHVLSCHGSEKLLHKCIVGGCSLRFGSKTALEKHVNHHFSRHDGSKRGSDQFLPKLHRHKKEKRRKGLQPWAARRFDYIDIGMMEGILFKLISAGALITGPKNSIVFQGKPTVKRNTPAGAEYLVQWIPCDVIPDQWLTPASLSSNGKLEKHVHIHELSSAQRVALHKQFMQIGRTFLNNNTDDADNMHNGEHRQIVMEIIKNNAENNDKSPTPSSLSTSSSSSSLSCIETTSIATPTSQHSVSSTPSLTKRYRKTPKTPLPS